MIVVDHTARAEDVRFLAASGECATGAAHRLGMTVAALEKWCRVAGLRAEWAALRAREPADPLRSETARAGAAARWSA